MSEIDDSARMAAKENVVNAKYEVDKLRAARHRGEVTPAETDEHRAAENAAAAELEAAKDRWFRIDPENAPDPKASLYVYP